MTSAAISPTKKIDRSYLWSRIGSLLGVLPLGVWTVAHLWNNLSVFSGGDEWTKNVTEYRHPVSFFATSLVALLPIALHSIWGIGRIFSMKPNAHRSLSNTRYWLQRLSAVGVLLFLGAHIWKAFIDPRVLHGAPESFHDIAWAMGHHGPTLAVYVLGMLGVAYHLANGLHTFCMGWGVVASKRALHKLDWFVYLLFAVFLSMGWGVIYGLWDVGRQLPL